VVPASTKDGRQAVINSDAYKDCPEAVKKKVKSKKFTKKEKKDLKEVLGKFEPLLKCQNQPLKKIGRVNQSIDHDDDGKCYADPNTMGEWFADQGTLVLGDEALVPGEFADASLEFRGTAAHEITHALTNRFDPRTCKQYDEKSDNPLMKEWSKAAGWSKDGSKVKKTAKDKPPTDYAATNPSEDLSESVMLYMYNPDKLKKKSPKRYAFVKDLMGD
jgi:hypothetical protein